MTGSKIVPETFLALPAELQDRHAAAEARIKDVYLGATGDDMSSYEWLHEMAEIHVELREVAVTSRDLLLARSMSWWMAYDSYRLHRDMAEMYEGKAFRAAEGLPLDELDG